MTFTIRLWLLVLVTALTSATAPSTWAAGPSSGPVATAPVKNYGVVDDGVLSRSGVPTASGFAWLRKHGVKSVVNLTPDDDGERFLKSLGFERYFWLPMDGPPSEAQAEEFLSFVQDPGNWPLHMHCHAGKDRTGLMVALYRYAIEAWPLDKAVEEAKLYRWGKAFYPEYMDWLRRWSEHHPPGSHRRQHPGS